MGQAEREGGREGEREREREREGGRERKREREKEGGREGGLKFLCEHWLTELKSPIILPTTGVLPHSALHMYIYINIMYQHTHDYEIYSLTPFRHHVSYTLIRVYGHN